MSSITPPMSSRRRRLVATAALAALLPAFGVWLWLAVFRLSAEERSLVGVWRRTDAVAALDTDRPVRIENEYRPNRTERCRRIDARTGQVLGEGDKAGRWHVSQGALAFRVRANPLPRFLGGDGVFAEVDQLYALEWLDPDRFRLTESHTGGESDWVRVH